MHIYDTPGVAFIYELRKREKIRMKRELGLETITFIKGKERKVMSLWRLYSMGLKRFFRLPAVR